MLSDTPYTAKPGPRDLRGVRARRCFDTATLGSTCHLAEWGQAGRRVVLALCGARLVDARIGLDPDVPIDCDRCRHLRVERQKWYRA